MTLRSQCEELVMRLRKEASWINTAMRGDVPQGQYCNDAGHRDGLRSAARRLTRILNRGTGR